MKRLGSVLLLASLIVVAGVLASGAWQASAGSMFDVNGTINQPPSFASKIYAIGAIDLELAYNSAAVTKPWADGYHSYVGGSYYDYGDCNSCPYSGHNITPGNLGWTLEDFWYVASGYFYANPLPLIYATNGVNADQWYHLDRYAIDNHLGYATPMFFAGAFTEYDACHDPNNPGGPACIADHLDNTPAQGWTQLFSYLNQDQLTTQNLNWSTDVTWKQ